MDVASLIVKVTTAGVQTTQAQLDKLSATASNAQKSAGGLNLGMIGLTATLGLLTKEAIKMGDEWTNINSKLNLVTKTTQEFNKAQTELFNISQNTRTSLSASVELYRKLAVSTESLNISQNRLLKVTETINKAGIIGGGSKESINAALIQLGQGLASGALRGEELNSVLEQTPRLAKLIADGMGVQVGALKSLAEAGKITSETIIKAAETAVAYGCIKYADLCHNRSHDYVFSFDKMLDDKGNTAVYLLYALTRIRSIINNLGTHTQDLNEPISLDHDKEWKLAKVLFFLHFFFYWFI